MGLLGDVIEPYEPQSGDGYAVLKPRPSHKAYKTGRYDHTYSENTAELCSNSETHFARALNGENSLEPIEVDGQTVALQKRQGDHTALLIKPAILNGVRLPAGSIMTVENHGDGDYGFAFGRLSAFVLSDIQSARRELASVFDYEQLGNAHSEEFESAMKNFNQIAGRQTHNGPETPPAPTDSDRRIGRLLEQLHKEARATAEIAMADRNNRKDSRSQYNHFGRDPHNRDAAKKTLARKRLELLRTFGMPAVQQAKLLASS